MLSKRINNIISEFNYRNVLGFTIFIYYISLIVFDYPFRDDLSRSYGGYVDLFLLGRPLADTLYNIISFGLPVANISPLPKIISLALVICSSIIVYKYFFSSRGLVGAIACFLFLSNPFILQNFAYQYDSLPMTASILLTCIAACLNTKSLLTTFIIALSLLLMSLCLYQASIIICACLVLCRIIKSVISNQSIKETISIGFVYTLAAIIALTIYYLLVINGNNQLTSRGGIAAVNGIISNYVFINDRLSDLYSWLWVYLIALLPLLVLVVTLYYYNNGVGINALLVIPLLVLLFVLSLFPSLVLKEGFVGPRTLMAFSAFWIGISILLTSTFYTRIFCVLIYLLLMINSFMISFGFNGELRAQQVRYSTVSNQVLNYTLSPINNDVKKVIVHNKLSKWKEEKNYIKMNKFIDWMNPEEAWAFRFYLRNHGEHRVVSDWSDSGGRIPGKRSDLDTIYFSSIRDNDTLHIIMK
ncbi:glucosyltransferase domain-containing protein [Citrobacter werkmanii]|uniref:glucosyltransferase domain-containing protein n=1 Tax=Citrobacter werkmanii TaxID=67827 RepID=UPI00351CD051